MHHADHRSASGPQEKIVQPVELNRVNLARLRPPVRLPGFDPTHVTAGIVHLGLGGFHRAHMARYTHDLMDMRPDTLGWGIIGAGLMPPDRRMRDSLEPQDKLYTLVERSGRPGRPFLHAIGNDSSDHRADGRGWVHSSRAHVTGDLVRATFLSPSS
jgi:hypothetical protein